MTIPIKPDASTPEAIFAELSARYGHNIPHEAILAAADNGSLPALLFQRLIDLVGARGSIETERKSRSDNDDLDYEARFDTTRPENRFDTSSFDLFLRDVGRFPLLTPTEVVELYKTIEEGELARRALDHPDLPQSTQRDFQRKSAEGARAFELVVLSNLRLVINLATRRQGNGVELPDLVEEGIFGLIRAAQKFDYRLGHRFSTYATWWIRQSLGRAIANHGRVIRLPVHVGEELRSLKVARRSLENELQRTPTLSEAAIRARIPVERVAQLVGYDRTCVSADLPLPGTRLRAIDIFPCDSASVEDQVLAATHPAAIEELLSHLSEPHREILRMRFGLGNKTPMTLEEIGAVVGLTRERVRQIQHKCLTRLSKLTEARELAAEAGFVLNDEPIDEEDTE